MIRNKSLVIIIAISIFSCSNDKNDKLESEYSEVSIECFIERLNKNRSYKVCFTYDKSYQSNNRLYDNVYIEYNDTKQYLDISSFNFNEDDLAIFKDVRKITNNWNGFYSSYDLNGNGSRELYFIMIYGMRLEVGIYELHDNRFISLINYNNPLIPDRITLNTKINAIMFYDGGDVYIYKWDKSKKRYILEE